MSIVEWSQFIASAVGGAFGLVCFFEGMRRVTAAGAEGRGGKLAVFGVLIVGMLAANAYWQHRDYAEAAGAYRGSQAQASRELPPDWGKKMTPAKREAASQNFARGAYVSSGAIHQYFDISGQRKAFAPTPDDIKRRDSVVATAARLDFRAEENFQALILWLVLGASAFLFGLGFGLQPAAKPTEEEVETRVEPTLPQAPQPVPRPAVPAASPKPPAPAPAPVPPKPSAGAPVPPKPSAGAPVPPKPPAPLLASAGLPSGAKPDSTVQVAAAKLGDTQPLPRPAIGEDTVPLAKAAMDGDTVPMEKPVAAGDTLPLPKPAPTGDTLPMAKPAPTGDTQPLPKPPVGGDTVPLPKPPPGTFTPKKS